MKSYHKYKIENHEWVKTIPSHWSFAKIAHFSDLRTGGTPRKNVLAYWENGTIPWMTSGEVNEKNIYKTKNHITESGLNNSNANLLPENSVMMALSGQGKTKATVAILKTIAACSQSLAAFVCNENRLHYRYLFYYLERNYKNIRGLVGDNLRDGLSLTKLREFRSPIPPFPEQCAIADFLDRKSAQIDTLIAKKQRQIELLQEHRTALINQTVTKGLNPDAPMKDSGIEWLGELPAHWELSALRYRATMIVPMRDKPKVFDGDIPWIRIEDFTGKYIAGSKSEQKVTQGVVDEMNLRVFPVGTVLCSCSCNMGATAIVSSPLISNQTFIGIVPKDNLDSDFMFYLIHAAKPTLDSLGTGAIQKYLSRYDFESFRLAFPPLPEQRDIAVFLNAQTAQIDTMIAKIKTRISFYQEYRTGLISAAVTGKIDVRECI